MKNSTEQFLKIKSTQLKEVSPRDEVRQKEIEHVDFVPHDYPNLFRTSYTDMSTNKPKLMNLHYIPKYNGFVPRMKSENPFARNYTILANNSIRKFDEIRFSGKDSENYKEYILFLHA